MVNMRVQAGGIIHIQSWDMPNQAPAELESLLGVSWPLQTGAVASGSVCVLCTGPADWLVVSEQALAPSAMERWVEAVSDTTYRAVDLSDALDRIEIFGPEVRLLLSKGCSLDLHLQQFMPQRCSRTRLAGIPVTVWCRQVDGFACLVSASYGHYLQTWLADAALELQPSM